jgi:hypothetical protein
MPVPPRSFSRAALADARHRYEETREPVDDIATRLGIGTRTLHTNIRRWKWRLRRPQVPYTSPPACKADEPASAQAPPAPALAIVSPDAAAVAEDIQHTLQRAIAAIRSLVATLAPGSANIADAERVARVLAILTRTLQEVLRMTAAEPAPDEPTPDEPTHDRGPDHPDEFIQDLSRRLDEFARRAQGSVPEVAAVEDP